MAQEQTWFECVIGYGNIDRETEKAICIDGMWLPKSLTTIDLPEEAWRSGTYSIPAWLAYKKYGRDNVWAMIRAGSARLVEE
jgi:hypothetical protein